MENLNTKCKKRKSIHQTYPGPYSQSWNPGLINFGRSNGLFQGPKPRSLRAWGQAYSTSGRPDPTAPHLKYGVFRKRKTPPAPSMPPLKNFASNPKRIPQSPPVRKIPETKTKKQIFIPAQKDTLRKSNSPAALIFRTADNSYSKYLSVSKVLHVDIMPKRLDSLPPSYCPSPQFRSLPKSYIASPTRFLYVDKERA